MGELAYINKTDWLTTKKGKQMSPPLKKCELCTIKDGRLPGRCYFLGVTGFNLALSFSSDVTFPVTGCL
jgi:hypothetical protein